jgi:hypothetical protein
MRSCAHFFPDFQNHIFFYLTRDQLVIALEGGFMQMRISILGSCFKKAAALKKLPGFGAGI